MKFEKTITITGYRYMNLSERALVRENRDVIISFARNVLIQVVTQELCIRSHKYVKISEKELAKRLLILLRNSSNYSSVNRSINILLNAGISLPENLVSSIRNVLLKEKMRNLEKELEACQKYRELFLVKSAAREAALRNKLHELC